MATNVCPECGVMWQEGETCETDFHQMLFWEHEESSRWEVHHLMVLCYHLQHPSLYSQDGLANGIGLLTAFVRDGIAPSEIRRRTKEKVNSKNRDWKITARPDSKGAYGHPVIWTMRATDVIARGADHYVESIREWAQSAYDSIQAAENLV
ncbi:MAG: hypothetical protein GC179_00605 [Anaerolineaceae bacterium]|nr:hypothetical protein [Anaerolineaceae bacterium]